MLEQHEQYAPWGEVTPDFWETGARRQGGPPAPPGDSQRPRGGQPEPNAEAHGAPAVDEKPSGPPVEFRDRVNAIIATLNTPHDAARLAEAATAAGQLDHEFTQRYGELHANTINLRELRGQLAYQQRQLDVAVRWCLHTASLQARLWGRDHRLTRGSMQRAVHYWLSIPRETQESAETGQELLAMLAPLMGEDSTLYATVRSGLADGMVA